MSLLDGDAQIFQFDFLAGMITGNGSASSVLPDFEARAFAVLIELLHAPFLEVTQNSGRYEFRACRTSA